MQHLYKPSSNNFNLIRLVAALFVVLTHSFDIPGNGVNEPLRNLFGIDFPFSYLGLSTFFLISGFLITQSWVRQNSFKQFVLNRLLRIVPGLAVVVVLTMLVYGPVFTTLPLGAYFGNIETYTYLKNILIIQTQGHLPGVFANVYRGPINGSIWTLPYEVLFYLCVPFASGILFRTKLRSFVTVLALISAAYWMLVNHEVANMYSSKLNIYRGSLVLFGGFFAMGSVFYTYHEKIAFRKDYFWAILLGYIVLISFGNIILIRLVSPFVLGYLVFCLALWPSKLSVFGKNMDLSYGIYIYAYPLQIMVIYYFHVQNAWVSLLIVLSLVIPLALSSWYFVEKPALKLRRGLKMHQAKRPIEVTPELNG
jgi:peptidoglycan/LPS O-acetylase OafA/YrhL